MTTHFGGPTALIRQCTLHTSSDHASGVSLLNISRGESNDSLVDKTSLVIGLDVLLLEICINMNSRKLSQEFSNHIWLVQYIWVCKFCSISHQQSCAFRDIKRVFLIVVFARVISIVEL